MSFSSIASCRIAAALTLAASFIAASAAHSQTSRGPLLPGEYQMEGGSGVLVLKKGKQGSKFDIETVGANGHSCSLDGEIRNGRTTVSTAGTDAECTVSFNAKSDGIQVDAAPAEACRAFCGARASFEGLYLRAPTGCAATERSKARQAFKRAYDDRHYADAEKQLAPLLSSCAKTLSWRELGSIRNDLAITQHHLGHDADCLATLQPLAADAGKSDDQLRESYPPIDFDSIQPLVRATRTNLQLCQGGKGTS